MIRRRMVAALAAAGLLFTAGCGGSNNDKPSADAFTEKGDAKIQGKGQTLDVWIMEGTAPDAKEFFAHEADEFKQQTGATLNVQFVPWEDALTKFNNVAGSDAAPDVAEFGATYTPEFAEAGALLPIDQQMKEAGLTNQMLPSLVQAGTVDGKLYGLPWYGGIRAFLYNKDMFKKAGIQPPKNWSELQADCGKLKQANSGVTPLPIAGGSEFPLYPFILGAGGTIANQDGDAWKSGFDSDKSVQGIQYYTDLSTKHGCSSNAFTTGDEGTTLDQFENGKAAMIINGSWTPATVLADKPELKGKIGAFPIPGKNGGIAPSIVGGSHLGIFANSEHPDLAWAFVRMMATGKDAQAWATSSHFFPAQESLLKKATSSTDPLVAPFAKQLVEGSATVPVTPLWTEVQGKTIVPAMLQSILEGSKSAPDAAKEAADEMNAVFDSGH